MESVYMPQGPAASVTEPDDLNKYFSEYTEFLRTTGSWMYTNKRTIAHRTMLGLEDYKYHSLKEKFDSKRYTPKEFRRNRPTPGNTRPTGSYSDGGFSPEFNPNLLPKNITLKSIMFLSKRNMEDNNSKKLLKYNGEVNCDINIPSFATDKYTESLTELSDYLIKIRVYVPSELNCFYTDKKRNKPLQVSQEFLVYGDQTLDILKDRILCSEDFTACEGDVCENPFISSKVINKDIFKSGSFFINDVFYNDNRHGKNIDYSDVIMQWAKEYDLNLNKKESMENTKFKNITYRLGYPYLYMHQGSCEHVIVFTDARLVTQSDVLVKSAYPLMISYANLKGNQCFTCTMKPAKFIVLGMDKLPAMKCYLCGECLFHYCYIDGVKIWCS